MWNMKEILAPLWSIFGEDSFFWFTNVGCSLQRDGHLVGFNNLLTFTFQSNLPKDQREEMLLAAEVHFSLKAFPFP